MRLSEWPDCLIPSCPNKCCLALDSSYCWPHTKGPSFDELMSDLAEDHRVVDVTAEGFWESDE